MKKREILEKVYTLNEERLQYQPRDKKAWYSRGFLLIELRRLAESLFCYDILIELNPNDDKAWAIKGYVLSRLGKDEEAIRCYDRAIMLLMMSRRRK